MVSLLNSINIQGRDNTNYSQSVSENKREGNTKSIYEAMTALITTPDKCKKTINKYAS